MNTTFRARTIPTVPDGLFMSLVCRWGGLQLEGGLREIAEKSFTLERHLLPFVLRFSSYTWMQSRIFLG